MMEIETACAADMLPVRAHEHDAGADLKAARDVAIRRGDTAKVSTGVRVSYCVDVLEIDTSDFSEAQERRTMKADVIRRAKKLAGIEEARND